MKNRFLRISLKILAVIAGLHILMFIVLYFFQEKLLFRPELLAQEHVFTFACDYEEIYIPVEDKVKLHGILFKVPNPKGLVFYLHGNGGSLNGWGQSAEAYTAAGYDIFMLDYRGYGKSGGSIESENQLFSDIEAVFNEMLKRYRENAIIIAGYSIGTGPAAHLAAGRDIKALILQAPYYSLSDLIGDKAPVVPEFVKRYKIKTFEYIQNVTSPVYIFHGTADELIDFSHAERLIKYAKPLDRLIPIPGVGHDIKENEILKNELLKILK